MSFPQSHTVKYHIAAYVHRNQNSTSDDVCKSMPGRRSNYVRSQIAEMIVDLLLTKDAEGALTVCRNLGRHIDQLEAEVQPLGDLVPSREDPAFRPIQPKNMFWLNPRFEMRDICFKSIGNPSPYYGNAD